MLLSSVGWAVAAAASSPCGATPAGVSVTEYLRTVDLSGQVVAMEINATFRGVRDGDAVCFFLPPSHARAFISAYSSAQRPLIPPVTDVPAAALAGSVGIPVATSGGKASVRILLGGTNIWLPKEVAQGEAASAVHRDSAAPYLAVPVAAGAARSSFLLPKAPLSHTPGGTEFPSATDAGGRFVSYGPNAAEVAPFAMKVVKLHYPTAADYAELASLHRVVEVSHWGAILLEEHIDLLHAGPKLAGSFTRLSYAEGRGAPASFRSITTHLPRGAYAAYFRDSIGNISTSTRTRTSGGDKGRAALTLSMRYPMLGGWRAVFHWGYILPAGRALSANGHGRYSLRAPVGVTFLGTWCRNTTTDIWLPEDAHDVAVTLRGAPVPFEVDRRRFNLDIAGRVRVRVTLGAAAAGFVDDTAVVTYAMHPLAPLREAAMLSGAVFAFLLVWFGYTRYRRYL